MIVLGWIAVIIGSLICFTFLAFATIAGVLWATSGTGWWHGGRTCRCGDPHAVHLHYTKRHKRYCGMCDCPKYKPVSWDQWIRELTHG
jgi:hypothetical protein